MHQCTLLFVKQAIWKNIWNEYAILCSVERRDSSMVIILWCGHFVYVNANCNALLNKNHCASTISALTPTCTVNSESYNKQCSRNTLQLDQPLSSCLFKEKIVIGSSSSLFRIEAAVPAQGRTTLGSLIAFSFRSVLLAKTFPAPFSFSRIWLQDERNDVWLNTIRFKACSQILFFTRELLDYIPNTRRQFRIKGGADIIRMSNRK